MFRVIYLDLLELWHAFFHFCSNWPKMWYGTFGRGIRSLYGDAVNTVGTVEIKTAGQRAEGTVEYGSSKMDYRLKKYYPGDYLNDSLRILTLGSKGQMLCLF